MTPLDDYLNSLPPYCRSVAREWIESRPPEIRALIEQYPPGATIDHNGQPAYLLGYAEVDGPEPGLWFSLVDPAVDYERANRERFFVCAEHVLPSEEKS